MFSLGNMLKTVLKMLSSNFSSLVSTNQIMIRIDLSYIIYQVDKGRE